MAAVGVPAEEASVRAMQPDAGQPTGAVPTATGPALTTTPPEPAMVVVVPLSVVLLATRFVPFDFVITLLGAELVTPPPTETHDHV